MPTLVMLGNPLSRDTAIAAVVLEDIGLGGFNGLNGLNGFVHHWAFKKHLMCRVIGFFDCCTEFIHAHGIHITLVVARDGIKVFRAEHVLRWVVAIG